MVGYFEEFRNPFVVCFIRLKAPKRFFRVFEALKFLDSYYFLLVVHSFQFI